METLKIKKFGRGWNIKWIAFSGKEIVAQANTRKELVRRLEIREKAYEKAKNLQER